MKSFSLWSYRGCAVTEANESYKIWARALLASLLINAKGKTHPQTLQKHQYSGILQILCIMPAVWKPHLLVHDENKEKGDFLLSLFYACRKIVTLASVTTQMCCYFLQRWVSFTQHLSHGPFNTASLFLLVTMGFVLL